MESRVNYAVVGLFVISLLLGLFGFAYWLAKYGDKQDYDPFYVYISESVAGLSTDSSVKYKGVDVGTVAHIGINSDNSEEVELLLKIKHGTPIKVDTKAKLKSFGLTGLVFIELTGSGKNAQLLQMKDGKIPIIPASPSTFAQIDESVKLLVKKLARALDKFDLLLSEKNLASVTSILSETSSLIKDLSGQTQQFRMLVDKGVVMESQVISAFEKVESASVSVAKMSESLEKNYADVGRGLKQDMRQSFDLLNQLLYDLDIITVDLQKMIQDIDASPSDLLFKRSQPKLGPGEEIDNEK